ncbi:MFS transporter [Leifsonia sp. LS-T14]|uniref:MFS transporter n=1 Tax=unclassified Leifsonia TaxID=2663824 RepID=UPI0035A5EC3B
MSEKMSRPLILTLVAAQFLVMLDSSVLNVALPSIASDLRLDAIGTAWVLNAYFLSFGGLLLISGRAADVFGRRRMVLTGSLVLAVGSFIGAVAGTEWVLVVARLVQGGGAAILSSAAMSVILARTTGRQRATAMSGWGAASALGGALGVTLGGLLVGSVGWHGVLAAAGIVAILITGAALVLVSKDRGRERRRFDVLGAGLITAAAVASVYAVLTGPVLGWSSPPVGIAIGVALEAAVLFAFAERRSADPILPPGLLREARVVGGLVVNLAGGAARIGCFVLVALMLQQVLTFSPPAAGLGMLPTSLAGFAVSLLLLPKLLKRLGPQWVAFGGLLLLAAVHFLLAGTGTDGSYFLHVLPLLLLAAAGVALSFTPTTLVISEGVAARNAGVGSGLASASAQLGGALGIAVYGAVDAAGRATAIANGSSGPSVAAAGVGAAQLTAAGFALFGGIVAAATFPQVQASLMRIVGLRSRAFPVGVSGEGSGGRP